MVVAHRELGHSHWAAEVLMGEIRSRETLVFFPLFAKCVVVNLVRESVLFVHMYPLSGKRSTLSYTHKTPSSMFRFLQFLITAKQLAVEKFGRFLQKKQHFHTSSSRLCAPVALISCQLVAPNLSSYAECLLCATHFRCLFLRCRDLVQRAPPADGCPDTTPPAQLLREKTSERRQAPQRGRQRIK